MLVVYPVPPYRLDLTACALRRLPGNEIDRWDGKTYRRVLALQKRAFEISVEQPGPDAALVVRSRGISLGAEHRGHILPVLARLLGWSVNLERPSEKVSNRLAERFAANPGLKPYRFATAFEAVANGLITRGNPLNLNIAQVNRLGESLGPRYGGAFGFPASANLASATVGDMTGLGLNLETAGALLEVARMINEGLVNLNNYDSMEARQLLAQLEQLPGISREVACYIAVHGYGRWEWAE